MRPLSRTCGALAVFALLAVVSPAVVTADEGDVQGQISVYTGDNAVGYLQPLANALGAALNSGFGYSAYIPKTSFHLSVEAPVMGLFFEDDDRTFQATAESGFVPQPGTTSYDVPTVVGGSEAVIADGQGGAQFAFPGGFDLNSFGLAVPQLRLSSIAGTEAVVRWAAFETGDNDLGNVDMFGIGGRHSVSQYFGENPPLDVAVGVLYQQLEIGENDFGNPFVDTSALTVQLQGSRRMPVGFMTFEPYGGVAYESLDLDVEYADSNDEAVAVSMEGENSFRFTIGAGLNFAAGQVWADYNFSDTSNFTFGLALGNVGR